MNEGDRGETDARTVDPPQVGFWDTLGRAPLGRADVEPYGIEYLSTPARLREIRRLHPCPTVIDAGDGIFGTAVGLLYVDDENGRAVAYAPPQTVLRAAIQERTEVIRMLREGLAMIDALASDQCEDASTTLRRVHETAIETLRRARVVGLDGGSTAAPH